MKNIKIIISNIFKLIIAFIFSIPFLWMINSSFRTTTEIQNNPLGLVSSFNFSGYIYAWKSAKYSIYMRNSIVIVVLTIIILVFVSSLAAYALARFKLPFRNFVLFIIMGGLIVPPLILIFPIYRFFEKLLLLDNIFGLVILYTAFGIPFTTFVLRAFFLSLPKDLEDAAKIDGCNRLSTFFRVVLPTSMGAISTVIIFNFIGIWNEFVFAYTLINTENSKPISAGLGNFIGRFSKDFAGIFSAVTIATLPIIILFIIFQKYFIEAFAGSVKE